MYCNYVIPGLSHSRGKLSGADDVSVKTFCTSGAHGRGGLDNAGSVGR